MKRSVCHGLVLAMALATGATAQTTILVHGHRGSRATRPENTLPAFQYAIDHGADVIELDLAVTKDDQLVVSHSPFLEQPAAYGAHERVCTRAGVAKAAAPVAIRTLTLAEVEQYDCGAVAHPQFPKQVAVPGTHPATFDQVLDLLAKYPQLQANVETKSFPSHPEFTPTPDEFVRLIVDAIARHHSDESRIILQSFDFRTLKAMRAQNPHIRLAALVAPAEGDALFGFTDHDKSFRHVWEVTHAEIISPESRLVTPEAVAEAHKLGAQVVPWTVNDAAEWQRLVDCKVDAIISDDPEQLVQWLGERHLHTLPGR